MDCVIIVSSDGEPAQGPKNTELTLQAFYTSKLVSALHNFSEVAEKPLMGWAHALPWKQAPAQGYLVCHKILIKL
jgi:hypothetical protein